MNVLLVNANPIERAWCDEHAHLSGYEILACSTGNVALEHCRQTFFPIIVFDAQLPDMSPGELCQQIRALPQEKRSMLLALVDSEYLAQLQALIDADIDDYVVKPLESSALITRLRIMERRVKHEHAMEILRTAQTYAGNIVESSLDMIIAVDLRRHIVEFNKAAQQAFGYRLEEVLGKHVDILYADVEKASHVSRTTLENGRCVQEIMNRRKNGEVFPCLLSASILRDTYGNPIGIMGISRDITDRKQSEMALQRIRDELEQQNQALARASKLKDDFLSLISHELRTPLTVILSQAELMKERLYGGLTEPQRTAVESIEQNGNHLLTLINDMLDFSHMTHGYLELTMVPVALETLCQVCLDSIQSQALTKHIDVEFEYDRTVSCVQADKRLMKQIVLQLLNNAIKFTPEYGKAGLLVQGNAAQGVVCMTVWDTGIGIAKDDLERLFQPFVQLDARLSREYVGAGLGLAIAGHLAHLHEGKIDVESAIGEGSRFTFTFPWKRSELKADDHESAEETER
jgi:PAS domain S-box-containing protein